MLANDTTFNVESYTLPDGRIIKLGAERFSAPEAMFQPHLLGRDENGVAELLFNTIQVLLTAQLDRVSNLFVELDLVGAHVSVHDAFALCPQISNRVQEAVKVVSGSSLEYRTLWYCQVITLDQVTYFMFSCVVLFSSATMQNLWDGGKTLFLEY